MIPWETLDRAQAPDGSALTLVRHGGDYAIRADGTPLMGSRAHASEYALGARACAGLADTANAHVLIGGMGMGFTLRAALDAQSAASGASPASPPPPSWLTVCAARSV